MIAHHQTFSKLAHGAVLALSLLICGGVLAQHAGPFGRLAGQWSGSGTIDLANGAREPIKCRASYDVLDQDKNLQLSIRCASDSYNFDLHGAATYSAGAITGSWSEMTRNAGGTLTGQADENRVQVLAKSSSFSATLTLVTHGDRQTVSIKAQDAQASVKGASINLRRS